jgi:transposase-like protein
VSGRLLFRSIYDAHNRKGMLANTLIIDKAIRSNTPFMTGSEVKCPRCRSEAIYRYGRTHNGKRRFICILCRRQFSVGAKRCKVKDRPDCPQCGRPMHIYKREKGYIRFRCSAYPQCRTYKKIVVEQE